MESRRRRTNHTDRLTTQRLPEQRCVCLIHQSEPSLGALRIAFRLVTSRRSSTAGRVQEFFENSAAAFEEKAHPNDSADPERITQIVDFGRRWSEKSEISAVRFIEWLDITASKFYDWRER